MLLKHWLRRPSLVRRPVRARNRRRDAVDRSVPQCVEHLEDRCLLSAVGGAAAAIELPSFQVDTSSHAESHILVRFKEGARLPAEVEGGELMRGTNLHKVRIGQGAGVAQAVEAFQRRPNVLYAQPDYTLHILGHEADGVPNDRLYQNGGLWGLNNTGQNSGTDDADIDAAEAWHTTTGSSDIVVGVIDTGVDYTHPDLADNIWTNPGEIPGNGVDDDRNGYVDDIHGYDFVNNDGDPMDDHSHGTHVSGTIGAVGNNDSSTGSGTAIVGVAWDVSIMGLKFLSASGSGSSSNAIRALDYATTMRELYVSSGGTKGANILLTNNSWGGGGYEQALKDAIDRSGAAGILFVAAAGNGDFLGRAQDNDTDPSYPASYDSANIIAVAATDRNDQYASFSNYGKTTVDLAAPGVEIWSTIPFNKDTSDGSKDGYARYNGTSMATPHVSGAVALVLSANPDLATWDSDSDPSTPDVKSIILSTVDLLGTTDKTVTDGRLNVFNALQSLSPSDGAPTVTITTPADGETVSGTVTVTADATDDDGVSQVEFFVDGISIGVDSDGLNGWSASWDTTAADSNGDPLYPDASYMVGAKATDAAGQTTSQSITVAVDNVDDKPTVTITTPAAGTTVSGTVTVSADASDDDGVSQVEFFVDGISIGVDLDGLNGWSASWDTTATDSNGNSLYPDASYTVGAKATDTAGQTTSDSISVTVDNTTPAIMYVGDLDGAVLSNRNTWAAQVTITVLDANNDPVSSATVKGTWSGGASGTVEATTGSDGRSVVTSSYVHKSTGSITFTVDSITHGTLAYDNSKNTDPDGDSSGTSIVVNKDGTTSAPSSTSGTRTQGQSVFVTDSDAATGAASDPTVGGSGQADQRVVQRDSAGTSTAPSSSQSTSTGTGSDGGAAGPDSAGNQDAVETQSSLSLGTLDGVFADSLLVDALLSV